MLEDVGDVLKSKASKFLRCFAGFCRSSLIGLMVERKISGLYDMSKLSKSLFSFEAVGGQGTKQSWISSCTNICQIMMRCHTGAVVASAFNVLIHEAFEVIARSAGKETSKIQQE